MLLSTEVTRINTKWKVFVVALTLTANLAPVTAHLFRSPNFGLPTVCRQSYMWLASSNEDTICQHFLVALLLQANSLLSLPAPAPSWGPVTGRYRQMSSTLHQSHPQSAKHQCRFGCCCGNCLKALKYTSTHWWLKVKKHFYCSYNKETHRDNNYGPENSVTGSSLHAFIVFLLTFKSYRNI